MEFDPYFVGVVVVDGFGRDSLGFHVKVVCGEGEVGGDDGSRVSRLHARHATQEIA